MQDAQPAITVTIPKKLTAYDKAHANPPWYEKAVKFQHKMRW